ncbi:restriction endonuclease subunit S [Streptomyces sp. NPDC087850]|uniref:restriction endonuclease subunit S n=1 Tax=Streptomyces sp. NPDC087850 TaxID=3365809 RepID=UPI0037F53331
MVRYLRAANVKDGALDLTDVQSMNFTPAEQSTFALRPGDVLVTEGSGSLGSVGASAVWRGELDGMVCFQNTLLRIRPRAGVDGRYLEWWARSAFGSGVFSSIASGANIYHLSAERVRALPISLPPLEEQRRISDFLDAETAYIDALSSLRKTQHTRLDERGYAAVSEILAPGILSNPAGTWPWAWLPKMPADRPLVRLGYVCRLQTGLTVDGKREVAGSVVTRPYLRVANVQAGRVNLDNLSEITVPTEIARRATLRAGDVLMTEGGDLDKLGRGTVWRGEVSGCLHQNHVFALRTESNNLDADYLALMTRTLHGRNYFESTGVKTTNLASTNSNKILSFPIPLPSVAEQRNLAKQAQTALDKIATAGRLIDRQLKVLTERRQALITAAVTGQIDVSTASGRGIEE